MENYDLISVIVPVYNAEKNISFCLESILAQSYSNFEIILVDDESVDNSASIIEKFKKLDNRIRYYWLKHNGSGEARNKGISLAKGKFIVFVDSDDFVSSKYLETLYFALNRYDCDIAECGYKTVYNRNVNDEDVKNWNLKDVDIVTNIDKIGQLCTLDTYLSSAVLWNKIYKKSLFEGLKFPKNHVLDDEFLIHVIYFRAHNIAIFSNILYYYYQSPESLTRSINEKRIIDRILVLEEQMNFYKNINYVKFANKIMYRYYYFVYCAIWYYKKYNNCNDIPIKTIKKKRAGSLRVLFNRESRLHEKISIILLIINPSILFFIKKLLIKNWQFDI